MTYPPYLSGSNQQTHLVVKQGETGSEVSMNFAYKYLFHIVVIFNMPSNLMTWDRWLYVPYEGSHATDFSALKNPLCLAGFEPMNLGPNGKHDKHKTTDEDFFWVKMAPAISRKFVCRRNIG
jgi:hypothetical protein